MLIGGERFSHMMFLGDKDIIKEIFGIEKYVQALSIITRLFGKIKSFNDAIVINERIWKFIDKILPYKKLRPEWLSFDSSVLTRYGNQEGAKKGYNPKKPRRNSYNPIIAFLNKSRYLLNIWNRSGNSSSRKIL